MEGHLEAIDPLDGRQYLVAVRRLADTLSYGTDHSPFLGSGIEFVQSRAYVPGDPIKAIDWKVTARTGRVHVKEFEAPKRMPERVVGVHRPLFQSAGQAQLYTAHRLGRLALAL